MQLSERNNLMKAVFENADNSVLIAGARALGIIGKLITGPLMRYIYGSGGNILDLNPILQQLHSTIKDAAQNASMIRQGRPVLMRNLFTLRKMKYTSAY